MSETTTGRRTKRRYAHEMYPHAEYGTTRPLAVEVPYLYARMVGFDMWGTSWSTVEPRSTATDRTMVYLDAVRIALLADALAQGMTGDEAWQWADGRIGDGNEIAYERAEHYGVPIDDIKPYPCGPEPTYHNHLGAAGPFGRESIRVEGRESECEQCTEPVTAGVQSAPVEGGQE